MQRTVSVCYTNLLTYLLHSKVLKLKGVYSSTWAPDSELATCPQLLFRNNVWS